MNKNQTIIIAILLMLGAFAGTAYLYTTQQSQGQQQALSQHADALVKPHSPRKGNPDAKVTIVEFMDPACETCRRFHPVVTELLAKYEGKVNLVVRYAPFHDGSDQMVKILAVMERRGNFWQVLEMMFETQPHWASHHNPQPEVFWQFLERYGFDMAQLSEQLKDPALDEIVRQDLADGLLLGANKTPTFFVNGKPLPSFGYQQLLDLVEAEVLANY